MVLYLATVGWNHPSRLLPSILQEGIPSKVVLIRNAPASGAQRPAIGEAISDWMAEQLAGLGAKVEIVETEPFSVDGIVKTMQAAVGDSREDVKINITGGTKMMAIAGMMFASLCPHVKAVYYAQAESYGALSGGKLDPGKIRELPTDAFQSSGFRANVAVPLITDIELARKEGATHLLEILLRNHGIETVGQLVQMAKEKSGVSQNTLRTRLQQLSEHRLIALTKAGREVHPELTPAGKQLAQVLVSAA